MLSIEPARLRRLLEQLDGAREDHSRWNARLTRTIVCRLPPDPHDLGDDPHLACEFGRWCHLHPPAELRDHPAFAAMQAEHRRLHQFAARLLRAAAADVPVVPGDFDEYLGAREKLTLELDSLRHEIQGFLRNRDALTGAHRRLDLLAELRELLELSRRGVQSCCIAFVDLDHFKEINDTYGHRVGDQVLAATVAFLMSHLRPFDKVFRYGGDEFLIAMPGADLAAGRTVIERMREGLAVLPLANADGTPIHVTASFGIALLERDLSVEQCIDNADRALFAAKSAGRNRAHSCEPADATLTGMLPFEPDPEAVG